MPRKVLARRGGGEPDSIQAKGENRTTRTREDYKSGDKGPTWPNGMFVSCFSQKTLLT
jgi:hypothetical protein